MADETKSKLIPRTIDDLLALPRYTLADIEAEAIGRQPSQSGDGHANSTLTDDEIRHAAERCQFPADDMSAITNESRSGPSPADNQSYPPERMTLILDGLRSRFHGWPYSLGGKLLFVRAGDRIDFLEGTAALFAWYATFGFVQWRNKGYGFVSQEQFFAEWCRQAKRWDAIEYYPHEPTRENVYYCHGEFPPSDGSAIDGLLDRFSPASDEDRELIKAMFATAVWGGIPGTRPLWLITATKGRGRGKSVLAHMLGYLFGGHIDLSANEDAAVLKQRLLTPDALGMRIALLDNVKSLKFSWAELESLITSPVISGKRLYHGNAQRANYLTWVLTLNGPSLSKDFSQRVVTINMGDVVYTSTWLTDTYKYIDANRSAIISDLLDVLRRPMDEDFECSRWGTWEGSVLAKLESPSTLQSLIQQRRHAVDAEADEAASVDGYFAGQLKRLGFEPYTDRVFIPSGIAAHWFSAAIGERMSTVAAGRRLAQMIDESDVQRLERPGTNKFGRGFVWAGEQAFSTYVLKDVPQRIKDKELEDAAEREKVLEEARCQAKRDHDRQGTDRTDGGQMGGQMEMEF